MTHAQAFASRPTRTPGRQSILTLQSSGDTGAAPEATIELRSLGGDDGNHGLIGFTGMCKLEEHTTEPTATAGLWCSRWAVRLS